jgi:ketosteroid isomerase-like protein
VSEGDVQALRRLYSRSFASLDSDEVDQAIEELMAFLAPEFEWHQDPLLFSTTAVKGAGEMRTFLDETRDAFEQWRYDADSFDEAGGRIVVTGRIVGRGRRGGAAFESEFGHVWTVRDGKGVRLESWFDVRKALDAAGLSRPSSQQAPRA